ncbi:beta-glucosidase [Paraburkholderia sp. RL18-101-BIB-B]|uniref:beta-glucosidase n=1 Tax=Paraburkholderia sp. RL18-101-BIB-B TaxID=3031634 RepID=UPI0038BB15F1
MSFPKDFVWGAATAAFQIEGANTEDGRGESIWDRFCLTPGNIADDTDGSQACDHYHRWPEDLDLAKWLNLNAWRFSVAWPRIQPTADGKVNQKGLDFYSRLVDGMLERGLAPFLTLYHWDLPQYLQDKGGWGSRETVDRYVEYASIVGRALGDRVASIATFNEPFVTAYLGHWMGVHAPGIQDPATSVQATHHQLLSHGRAVRALREEGVKAPLGIVLNLAPAHPASQRPEDIRATDRHDIAQNRLYLDGLFLGEYPERCSELLGVEPKVVEGDMEIISTPIDFLGVNYYRRAIGSAQSVPSPHFLRKENRQDLAQVQQQGESSNIADATRDTEFKRTVQLPPGAQITAMGWEVYHEGLRECLEDIKRRYSNAPPIYITESGAAFDDEIFDGRVADSRRTAYIQGQIAALGRAMDNGVDVRGYFVWSLLDNFEWALGYSKRFGITYVDYTTQQRTPKESALWYRHFVGTQR